MKIEGIDHIALICSDYEKSKRFYTEVLGFEVINETWRKERKSYKLDLSLNGVYVLELFTFPDSPQRPSYPEACGLRHLAFAVKDLEVRIQELAQYGITSEVIRYDPLRERRFVFLFDPDALPIELYEQE